MKKFQLTLLFFVLFIANSFAQPAIQWQNTIGGDSSDWFYSLQPTADGGYILGGYSTSNISGDKTENNIGNYDYWMVKIDSFGLIQWQNTIGGDSDDIIRVVKPTRDGGYILGGYSDSPISGDKTENSYGGFDYWIVKTDSVGNVLWQKTFGGTLDDRLWSVCQTSDGGYILGGASNSHQTGNKTVNTHGGYDYWTIKTDSLGNSQWQMSDGGTQDDFLYSLELTSDGGHILGGSSRSSGNGDKTENTQGGDDYWIIKADSTGNIVWQNDIGGNGTDELYSVSQTNDGGYILGGYSDSNISGDKTENGLGWFDYWIVKTNATGVIQWQNTIGGDSVDYLYSIRQTADSGYILGGHSASRASGDKTENSIGGSDYWIVRTNSVGVIQWQNTIGGSFNEDCRAARQTSDGGYIVGGSSYSNISGDKNENSLGFNDYWIVKINHELRLESTMHSAVLCHGDSTGSAAVAVSGGAPGYTYSWIPSGGSGATASNLSSGTYTCSVTDTGGGITVTTFTITQPPVFTASVTSHTDLLCNGVSTGVAAVTVSGGSGVYTYQWNSVPVQTTGTAVNLAAGSYTVTVTDANGCTASDTITLTQPPPVISQIVSHQDVSCNGGSNGSAKVFAHGGTGALTYSWNTVPPQTNPTANNLTAGNYTCTVTDANGCTDTSSVTITEPPLLISFISSQTNISPCTGGNNGSAIVTAGGGTGAYTYLWSTVPVQNTATATNLTAGNYTVTVRDGNGCINSSLAVITEPLPVIPTVSAVTPFCGHSNGSVSVSVANGTPPYTYSWSTGDTTSSLTGLLGVPSDTLTLVVTDMNGCADTSVTILNCLMCIMNVTASAAVDSCPLTIMTINTTVSTVFQRCATNVPTAIAPDGAPCSNPNDTLGCPTSNYVYASLTSPPCFDSIITSTTIESIYVSLDTVPGTDSRGCGQDNRLWLRSPGGTFIQLVDTRPLNQNTDNKYKPTFTPAGTLGIIPNVDNVSFNGLDYMPDVGTLAATFVGESLYADSGTWIVYMSDSVSGGCTTFSRITEFCMTFRGTSPGLSYAWSSSGNCNSLLSDTTIANPQFTPPTGIYDCTYYVNVNDSCGCSGSDSVRVFCFSPLLVQNIQDNIFSIHPNPAHDNFTVSFNKELSIGNPDLRIYDVTGRIIKEQKLNSRLSTINCQLSAGVYFVKVQEGERVYTRKLVIE